VGNPEDPCKGLKDILIPATNGKFAFIHSDGKMTREEVAEFYNRIDVIAIASTFEGSPLPLIEGMVSGCFPVSTDVGIAPELIRHGENGLIVERSVEAFQEAFAWCEKNLDIVRAAGQRNAGEIPKARSWEKMIGGFEKVFDFALAWQKAMPEKPSRFSFLRRFFSA
jgi:glycosyltransferase involved in cell wall biosynthesis